MGEGYNTGDDVVVELFLALIIVTLLSQYLVGQGYISMILGMVGSFVLIFLVVWVSQGRIFWAILGCIFWVVTKLGLVKEDKTEYTGYWDEEGNFHLEEKKPEGST